MICKFSFFVFLKKFDFDPDPEMDPEPDPEPDPELSEKSDPDLEIIFSAPKHWIGQYLPTLPLDLRQDL